MLVQLFCQEEFLRKVEKSTFSENFVLKGGLFLYSLTRFDSRVTVDIDFLLKSIPNTQKRVREVIEEIISVHTGNDFISFEVSKVEPIAIAKKYSGISATLIARIKNTRTIFGVDFMVGDVIVPCQMKREIPTQLDGFDTPVVNTYSLETTVAEKLDAILNLMEFSSRMKDYFDLYYLSNKFQFNNISLSTAMRKTFENREHVYTLEQFEQMLKFSDDKVMQAKWVAFIKKTEIENVSFQSVLNEIEKFLRIPFEDAIN